MAVPFDFPPNPAPGYVFTSPEGIIYVWSGYAWFARVVYPAPTTPLIEEE